jgi:gamma-glutamyl phosphate reductase
MMKVRKVNKVGHVPIMKKGKGVCKVLVGNMKEI